MATPEILRTVAAMRAAVVRWRSDGDSVGLTPTMGALHEGHLALVRRARAENARVVATIFVNPRQFAEGEDFGGYPRNEEADLAKLAEAAVDAVFAPGAAEMYPPGFDSAVVVGGPAAGLESDFRPHFFRGVAAVVAKLLLIVLPDRAYFGEKDFQQLLVVKKLAADLNIPTDIVGCPTMREADGLALSSRNAYLDPAQRQIAPRLYAVLIDSAERLRAGAPAERVLERGREALAAAGFAVDYLEARDAETLARPAPGRPRRLLAAVRLGRTRLIDNVAV
jgi:pantoate--beta-alanine ligase